ncbi:hypothetical protein ASPZODRAFT_126509 [Penicilliopsis zonata CBS 506.65]|uniref:Zn(2)-C6 fungal-type domain-containing protein n=1 Tax=Penicilliopsis zonata CBS 506.65 TaxID=1073090 RepID=A0A1L9SU09_9EURO|nr:hypothetical protein ASPZODRAFT_126509 [Penicilliopsis zonata CBS 506.65]OJJ50616.1 hypothetical protein ASPZODRAFT_126509 [Penicilliopsis zonata CBS 506.65]
MRIPEEIRKSKQLCNRCRHGMKCEEECQRNRHPHRHERYVSSNRSHPYRTHQSNSYPPRSDRPRVLEASDVVSEEGDDEIELRKVFNLRAETWDLTSEDLELFRNWCESTEWSISSPSDAHRSAWHAIIRQQVFEYPILLYSTVALSAMELASGSEVDDHFRIALDHYSRAIIEFSHTLEKSPTGSNAAFVSVGILFGFELALLLVGESSESSICSLNDLNDQTLQDTLPSLLTAFIGVLETTKGLVGDSSLIDTVEHSDMGELFTQEDPDLDLPNTSTLTILMLKTINSASARDNPSHEKEVYDEVIVQLGQSLEKLAKVVDPLFIALRFLLRIPRRFLTLLATRQPLALAILAHYCAVMHHLRDRWWMGDLGARVLKEISHVLGPDMVDSIQWATDIVGVSVDNNSDKS